MIWVLVLLMAGVPALRAQGTTSSISGTIWDATDKVLPGVTVTVTHLDTSISRTLISDDAGGYRAQGRESGTYEVKAELTGFQTSIRTGIQLTVGRGALVNLILKVGEMTEQVIVSGETSPVAWEPALSGLVTNQQIANLPLNGRNLIQLTLLEAGVSNVIRSSAFNGNIERGFGIDISVTGARPHQNSFLLDGADINGWRGKLPGSLVGVQMGVESVREVRVLTSNFSAQYGRAAGGIITAITKSGGNQFHGSLFAFHRNDNLDATDFISNSRGVGQPPLIRNQFGGSIGGPIIKDRTFFFFSYEGLRDRTGVTGIANVPTVEARQGNLPGRPPITVEEAVKPYLDLWVLPDMCGNRPCRENGDGMAEHAVSYTQPTDENYFTARIDHSFSDNHSFFGRWTLDDADRRYGFNTVNWIQANTLAHYWTLEVKSIFTPKLLNVIRYSFIRTHQVEVNDTVIPIDPSLWFLPEDQQLGSLWISGAGQLGSSVLSPTPSELRPFEFVQNLFQFSDGLTYTTGRQTWKVGADIRRYQYNGFRTNRIGGRYRFFDFEDFLMARPFRVEGPFPGSDFHRGLRQWIMGFYVEDNVQVRPNFTVNVGLRYEFTTVPTEVNGKISNLRHPGDAEVTPGDPYFLNPSKWNFAPRVGFSWDPFGDGRTAVRSAFGLFHALVDINAFGQPYFTMPPGVQFNVSTRDFPDGQIPFPDPLAKGLPPGSFIAFSIPFDSIKQPYLMKWNLDLQREIFQGTLASVGYIGSRGVKLWTDSEYNICLPDFSSDGRRFFQESCEPRSPHFSSITARKTPSSSFYHALIAKVNRRFSNDFALQVSYTFSKSIDDESGYRIPSEPGGTTLIWQGTIDNQQAVRGLSDFNVQNNLVVSGSWALPGPQGSGLVTALAGGWQLHGILTLTDGYPVTPKISPSWSFDQGSFNSGYVPDLVPGGNNNPVLGGPDHYFDLTQFALPQEVTDPSLITGCGPRPNRCRFYGNLGRNTLISPGVATLDFSLMKKWPLAFLGEAGSMTFRAEFFNIFNRANFAAPGLRMFNSRGQCCGSAGRITSTTTTARQIQLALRMTF